MNRPLKRIFSGLLAGVLLMSVTPASADTRLKGDLNSDGAINSFDQRFLLQQQGTGSLPADLTGDGVIDTADADLLWQLSFGTATDSSTTTSSSSSSGSTSGSSSSSTSKTSPTKKPTTSTTTKTTTTTKPTTTTTKPTTTTTKPTTSSGEPTVQSRPTLAKVTTPAYTPTVRTSGIKDSTAYKLQVKCSTGTVYDNSTQENLQKLLAYVVKNEMGTARFASNSTEAWKAQAVATYTFLCYSKNNAVYTYGSKELNLNDANDKKIYDAVGEVLGVKMLDNNSKPICAYYFASAPGTTRNSQTVTQLPYIQPVFSPETDELCKKYGYSGLYSTKTYTLQQIIDKLSSYLSATVYAESKDGNYPLYARSWTGAYISETNLYYYNKNGAKTYVTGRNVRDAYGANVIRSASFVVAGMSGNTMTLTVMGHGHGMGFSQVGAAIFANEYGWNYRQILAHYFSYGSGAWQFYGMNW